jgi:hypothetical protein
VTNILLFPGELSCENSIVSLRRVQRNGKYAVFSIRALQRAPGGHEAILRKIHLLSFDLRKVHNKF